MGIYVIPTENAMQTTLASNLNQGETGSLTLADDWSTQLSGVSANRPAVLAIDRVNSDGTATPSKREYIKFTGVSSTTISTLTRGQGGSSDQSHSAGAIVELVVDVQTVQSILDTFDNEHSLDDGTHGDVTATSVTTDSVTAETTNGDLTLAGNGTGKVKADASYGDIVTATDGATVTFNLANGNRQKVTLGGNRTLAISNASVGQAFIIDLIQDGTGSRTVTWFSTIKWAGGSAPTLTTTASKIDTFGFLCTSSGNYQGYIVGQNL